MILISKWKRSLGAPIHTSENNIKIELLKIINRESEYGLNSDGSKYGLMTGSCGNIMNFCGSIKDRQFLK
jgi:hypothetical protein